MFNLIVQVAWGEGLGPTCAAGMIVMTVGHVHVSGRGVCPKGIIVSL